MMIKLITVDLLLCLLSFLSVYYYREKSFILSPLYLNYLIVFLFVYVLSASITKKYSSNKRACFIIAAKSYSISFFLTLGFLALFIKVFDLVDISRTILITSLFLGFILELMRLKLLFWKKSTLNPKINMIPSSGTFITELFLFTVVYILVIAVGSDYLSTFPKKYYLVMGMYCCWFASIAVTYQYSRMEEKNSFINYSWGHIKSYILLIALVIFLITIVHIKPQLRDIIIGSIFLYSFLSYIVLWFIYIRRKQPDTDETNLKLLRATTLPIDIIRGNRDGDRKHTFSVKEKSHAVFEEILSQVYLKNNPEVFTFLSQNIALRSIESNHATIIRSSDPYNIEVLEDETIEFILNLHEMNDIRRLNAYFIEINNKLKRNGVFISRFEPNIFRHKRYLKSYPYYIAQIFYFFDFFWCRVLSKLPVFKNIYFAFTKGINRAISLAEGLGRLHYCGFEIFDICEIDNFVYFIAKKVNEPLKDGNPSYGPLFKMRRIGKYGKSIYVYKMRTMHPYAEYLQQFVFEKCKLKDGGKFSNDFRITYWGRVLRKLWIDELPMIINWLKGDLKLVGVRPLSQHYFDLYRDDLKERRIKFKPGLVPPYYADLPETLYEIMDSESRYLDQYEKHPIKTDVKYFFKAFNNIVIRGARSR